MDKMYKKTITKFVKKEELNKQKQEYIIKMQ